MKILMSYRERAAGAFVLTSLALVLSFFVGAAIRNRWFHPRVRFHGQMLRGEGMREGSPILLSGVEVGEVGTLTILEDNRVDVELLVWIEHAQRVRSGTRAVARRLFGIGEKRIQLTSEGASGSPLPANSNLPFEERMDLLDAAGMFDLSASMHVLDRAIGTADRLLAKLDEGDRLDRMFAAFDRAGPMLEKADGLLGDPNLKGAMSGLNTVLHDPATRKTLQRASELMAPERIDRLLARTESVLERVDTLTAKDGALDSTLGHANRLIGDGRADRLLASLVRLADADKLGRLLDNVAILAEQLGRVGPEIPALTREMALTMREAVVVLKALQQTWMLENKSEKARKEIEKSQGAKP
jgi:hypothetical protein